MENKLWIRYPAHNALFDSVDKDVLLKQLERGLNGINKYILEFNMAVDWVDKHIPATAGGAPSQLHLQYIDPQAIFAPGFGSMHITPWHTNIDASWTVQSSYSVVTLKKQLRRSIAAATRQTTLVERLKAGKSIKSGLYAILDDCLPPPVMLSSSSPVFDTDLYLTQISIINATLCEECGSNLSAAAIGTHIRSANCLIAKAKGLATGKNMHRIHDTAHINAIRRIGGNYHMVPSGYDVYIDRKTQAALDMWESNKGYAGLSLDTFLESMLKGHE